jgi:hypothetical protein
MTPRAVLQLPGPAELAAPTGPFLLHPGAASG